MDITVRRVVIPLAEWAAILRGAWERLLGRGKARRPAPQAQATTRLLGVKARAGTRRAEPDGATPAPTPVATPTAATPPTDAPTPVSASAPPPKAAATTPADTTSRLLERKRRLRQ
jgi:hypothetical protein